MKMRKSYLPVFCLLLCALTTFSQVKIFEENVISTNDAFGATFSPDEKEIYFVKSYGGRDKLHIMSSKKTGGKWSAPINIFSEDDHKYIDPFVTFDGNLLIFNTTRPKPNTTEAKTFRIWAMRKTGNGWSEPFYLGDTLNSEAQDFYATTDRRGNMVFTSRRNDGSGSNDLWFSERKNGAYQTPKNLGSPINTPNSESNPFISSKGDYLVYFSDAAGGFGDTDLYIAFRRKNGGWSKPSNLGAEINGATGEFTPYVSRNGKRLYFSRLKKDGEKFVENIYYYDDFDAVIKKLRISK